MSDLRRNPLADPAFWRSLDRRVQGLIARVARPVRGTLSLASGGSGLGALWSGRADEGQDDVEVAQHYGFASRPPDGVEAVAVPIGGAAGHLVVVGELDRSRPTLDANEVVIYVRGGGSIKLLADGAVEITPAGTGKVRLAGGGAAVARVGDSVTVTGTVTVAGTAYPITATASISGGSALVEAG